MIQFSGHVTSLTAGMMTVEGGTVVRWGFQSDITLFFCVTVGVVFFRRYVAYLGVTGEKWHMFFFFFFVFFYFFLLCFFFSLHTFLSFRFFFSFFFFVSLFCWLIIFANGWWLMVTSSWSCRLEALSPTLYAADVIIPGGSTVSIQVASDAARGVVGTPNEASDVLQIQRCEST